MKSIIYWFTRNHVAANFLMLIVLMVGSGTWFGLRKEIFPETAIDAVTITVAYPNASPVEVEKGVILPIEEALEGIDGLKRVTSTATQNVGAVTVEVETAYDVREVMSDVKTEVDAITNFAEAAEEPILKELVLKGRVLQIAVSADAGERVLREMAVWEGATALHAAVCMGKVEEVRELLARQADPSLRNRLGHTALENACLNYFGGAVPKLITDLLLTAA